MTPGTDFCQTALRTKPHFTKLAYTTWVPNYLELYYSVLEKPKMFNCLNIE
jgi:hypothetical protein